MGNLIERIANADNLRLAFWKASRGKRSKETVLQFRENLDGNLYDLRQQLLASSIDWGPYHTFLIHDPKKRYISAAPFRDRVAHHAIINVTEPVFESYQIHDSYACRKGKGLDGAITRALRFACKSRWYMKLDVRKFFNSVDHDVLKGLLKRRFKDRVVLNLFNGIIDSFANTPGRGIPIGNLTSQFFANHYLGVIDHYIKETIRCKRYVRYMDDFVIWAESRTALRRIHHKVTCFIQEQLYLDLKSPCMDTTKRGLTFLGYRVYPGRLRLARRSRDRFIRKLRRYHANFEEGLWDEEEAARHVEPLLAFVCRAESHEYRKRVMKKLGLCPLARTA
ncbi:MAG: RNA-directed DNA polymerase [Pirellulales bacterium]|nr:RNA-directed DNA polymerase [Pirellulales bacterium]